MDHIGTTPKGLTYIPNFLSETQATWLWDTLQPMEFTHDFFRGKPMRRGYLQFGYTYITKDRTLRQAAPLPKALQKVRDHIAPHCPPGTNFTQCIITRYPAKAGIGWHCDAPCFQDCIAGLSLGSEAGMLFRHNQNKSNKQADYIQRISPRSLYIMTGASRWDYQHKIEPVPHERISLTFRAVRSPEEESSA